MAFRDDDEKKKDAALQAKALREREAAEKEKRVQDDTAKKLKEGAFGESAFKGGAEHGTEKYWDTQTRTWQTRPTVKMHEAPPASSQAKALRTAPSPSPEPDYTSMTDAELDKAAAERDEKGNVKNQAAAMEKYKRQTTPKK